jgi:hypothetical protein
LNFFDFTAATGKIRGIGKFFTLEIFNQIDYNIYNPFHPRPGETEKAGYIEDSNEFVSF